MSISFEKKSKIIITCPKFIAPYLGKEVTDLGYTITEQWSTGVAIEGTINDCIKLNFYIRTGNQVLWLIKDFEAVNADLMYKEALTIEWENIIKKDGYLCITSNVENDTIDNNLFANVKLKDAIVDRMKEKFGIRPDSGPERNKLVIHLFWRENQVSVFIDTSGETLSKHNYRKLPGSAPMQESLAAATIMASGWDGKTDFVNPMCGSGTLAIEAALMALNKYPGLLRAYYSFMHIEGYNDEYYQSIRTEGRAIALKSTPAKIIATDINPNAINATRMNAQTAGVDHIIDFEVCDFRDTKVPSDNPGVVMINPEYGERLGEYEELEIIYKAIGDFLKTSCQGYKGFIFTASPNLAKKVGLKASQKTEFFNSKLECRLLAYELYGGSKREPKIVSQ